MHLKVTIFLLSFLTTAAFPLNPNSREATWTNPNANQAHEKTDLPKDVEKIYKNHIDSGDLYSQEDADSRNPLAEQMQRKLAMESERLRLRLRQELAELQERLSPSPARLSSAVAGLRERLAPLTQQLQSSLSSSSQDLCVQLRLYLQGLELAEAQAGASPALYQEAFLWMSQTLDLSGAKAADVIGDFQAKTDGVMEHLKESRAGDEDAASADVLQEVRSRLGREVAALREEAANRVGALRAELSARLHTAEPLQAELAAGVEQFCQSAALQSQVLQARMENFFQELEEPRASGLDSTSSLSATEPGGSLQGDYSQKLSALIQDILHSVQ